MKFESELISGTLIKRYKRFFVDIKINNINITAHCPNTGSMMGLLKKGNKVWVTKNDNPKRKLKYTLQIIETASSKVGVNTLITNNIFYEALSDNKLKLFGKEIGKDFFEGKVTLPVIIVYQKANSIERTFLINTFKKEVRNKKDSEETQRLIKKYKALEATFKRAEYFVNVSYDALGIFENSEEKNILQCLTSFSLNRSF